MNHSLPDVALNAPPPAAAALDWVGMRGIELPLALDDAGHPHWVQASVDVLVDLPRPDIKGIHMSRLYLLADALAGQGPVGPAQLGDLLAAMIASHADCGSGRARIVAECRLMLRQPALSTAGLAGWKSYPVRIEAQAGAGATTLTAQLGIVYSSTCPCSAALSRQLVAHAFETRFGRAGPVDAAQVGAWLAEHATLATPHSQRSLATVRLPLGRDAAFRWKRWIARIEDALATPVQTAVKRADEQAFARLNGANPMYVEDAARRVLAALADDHPGVEVAVRHFESLHQHDAFAAVGPAPA